MSATVKKTNLWPLLPAVLFVAFLGVTFWSIGQARQKLSPVTDADYYSHGLRYNQTRIEERAAESSGWVMRSGLTGRQLSIFLENNRHQPVAGCRGELVIYDGNANRDARRLSLPITETTPGTYLVEVPAELAGSLTGDLSLRRDGAVFNRRLLLNL